MSELINMEDDAPVPAAPAPAEEPAGAPAAAAAAESEAEPDASLDAAGLLAALKAERAEKKQFKEQAARAAQLEQELAQSRPYVDFLKAHPEVTQPRPAAPTGPVVDQEALDYARDFDLYQPDGKPDTEKARRILDREAQRIQKTAQSVIAPVQQMTHQQRASVLYQQALATPGPNGEKVDPGVLNQLIAPMANRPDLLADQGVMSLLHAAAIGFSKGRMPATVPAPAAPPIVTEGGGRAQPRTVALSDIDRQIAANKGVDPEKFGKLASGFVKGRMNQLED